jgi:hypothetical protein
MLQPETSDLSDFVNEREEKPDPHAVIMEMIRNVTLEMMEIHAVVIETQRDIEKTKELVASIQEQVEPLLNKLSSNPALKMFLG